MKHILSQPLTASDKIINDLLDTVDKATSKFGDALPSIQKQAFAKVIDIAGQLDKYPDGSIKPSLKNVKLMGRIKQEIDNVVYSRSYQKNLVDLTESFNAVAVLQQKYFSSIITDFKAKPVFEEIKRQAINRVSESLGKDALSSNVSSGVRDIMQRNITTGGGFSELVDQLRSHLMDSKDGDGALAKYAKTYATDALNDFSRNYSQMTTDDLGLDWFMYTGSLRETSRPFCKAMVAAKGTGHRYIHRSQFAKLLTGDVFGTQVNINKKTNLPDGFKPDTTVDNFQTKAAGWSCNHQVIPVMTSQVPDELRKQFG